MEDERRQLFDRAISDGTNPFFRGPEVHDEHDIVRSVRPVVCELFSKTENTPIPELIEQAIDIVSGYCKPNEGGVPYLIARGSWITRQVLGTPQNYWRLTNIFRDIKYITDIVGDSPIAKQVVHHAAEGPDVDIMYLLREGVNDADVFRGLKKWIDQSNTQLLSRGFRMSIEKIALSEWNGHDDTRVYNMVTFEKK